MNFWQFLDRNGEGVLIGVVLIGIFVVVPVVALLCGR